MSIWESILVALDNLRVNKLRSFLTMIGIVFGVAAVVTVVSIGQAGQASVISEVSVYDDSFFAVYPDSSKTQGEDVTISLRDLTEIHKVPGVRYASSTLSYSMKTKLKKEDLQFSITGTTNELPKLMKLDMSAGRFFSAQEERGRRKVLIVEEKYATKAFGSVNAALGRKVTFTSGVFRIIGVYKPQKGLLGSFGGTAYSAYAPVTAMPKSDNEDNNEFFMVQVVADSTENVKETVKSVKEWLADKKKVDPDVFVSETSKDMQQMVGSVFGILQQIIGSIAGISLLVGGIGVMNIMLVSVTERTREIGIRKAIGASPGTIMLQFMIEAVLLSFLGGIVGALLGLGAAYLFSLFSKMPFVVSGWAIILAFGFSAAVGIFFGLYPANKASKLHPIEALRYE